MISSHIVDTVLHVKTTLDISDPVMRDLRRQAQRSGRTMSELVETVLRSMLAAAGPARFCRKRRGSQATSSSTPAPRYTRDADFHRFPFVEVLGPPAL